MNIVLFFIPKEVTNMEIWHWQLLTVIPLGCMCFYLYFIVGNLMSKSDSIGEIVWIAELEKEGKVKTLELPEGSFLMGNGLLNDIRIQVKGPVVRLYMNVQKNDLAVSVIKGKVQIGNYTYQSDKKERISLSDGKILQLENAKIRFLRKVI